MNHQFQIDNLDHVAIRVADMERSIKWYREYFGLKPLKIESWGPYPVMMFSGQTGVALFPANLEDPEIPETKNVKIDHFAFRVSNDAFKKAQAFFNEKGLAFHFQDHDVYHSVYMRDPDGHTVELTTLVSPEDILF